MNLVLTQKTKFVIVGEESYEQYRARAAKAVAASFLSNQIAPWGYFGLARRFLDKNYDKRKYSIR